MKSTEFLIEEKTTLNKIYAGEFPSRDETFWDYVSKPDFDKELKIKTLSKHNLLIMLLSQYRVEHIDEIVEDMLDDDQKEILDFYLKDPNLSKKTIVVSNHLIIDGNHRALAAAIRGIPINYVDLSYLDDKEIDEDIEIPSGKSHKVKRTVPRYWYHNLGGRELGPRGEILPYKYGRETKIFQDEFFRDPKPEGFVYLSPRPLYDGAIKIDAAKLDPDLMRLTGQVEGYAIYAGAIPAEAQVDNES